MSVLREVVDGRTFSIHECRNCGEKLGEDADECPSCGATEVAHYEL